MLPGWILREHSDEGFYQEYNLFLPGPKPTRLDTMIAETSEDMITLGNGLSRPNLTLPEESIPAAEMLGAPLDQEPPLRLTNTVPANPSTRFDASGIRGSRMFAHLISTGFGGLGIAN